MRVQDYQRWRVAAGKRLQAERERAAVTQAELAAETDFTQQMISRYEGGRIGKSLYFTANMLKAGYDVHYILTGRRKKR